MSNPNVTISSDYGQIIININDTQIGRKISESGYWAKDDIELIKILIDHLLETKKSIVLYDIGANIGTHSLAIAKTYGEKARIRAFEAQRHVFYMLAGTIALNGLRNIDCHNLAVSDQQNTQIEFGIPDYNIQNNFGGLELIKPSRSDNDAIRKSGIESVLSVTIDSFSEDVDFIKMDIEGMEHLAMRGAINTLEVKRPIWFIEILKTEIEEVIGLLQRNNYCGFQKSENLIAIPVERNIQINSLARVF